MTYNKNKDFGTAVHAYALKNNIEPDTYEVHEIDGVPSLVVWPKDKKVPGDIDLKASFIECVIVQNINNLEAEITPRRMREAISGAGGDWLADKEAEIEAERAKL